LINKGEEVMKAKLITLVYVEFTRGDGTKENPIRTVKQYWTTDGKLIFEDDTVKSHDHQ
jgi:hypothetical protein